MRRKVPIAAAAALLLAALAASPARAISLDSLDVNASLFLIGTDDTITDVAPNPAVALALGVSLPIGIAGPFFAEAALDLYAYDYTFSANRALPSTSEAAAAFLAVGSLLSAQAGLRFSLTESLEAGMSVGVDALLRFPVATEPLFGTPAGSAVDAMGSAWSYFFADGRFLYPEARLFLRWRVAESLAVVFSVRAFYPIAHLWEGQNLAFWDELMLSGTVGFSIPLGGTPKAAHAAEPAPADQPAEESTPSDQPS